MGPLTAIQNALRIEASPWPWFEAAGEGDAASRLRRAAREWWWRRPVTSGEWRRLELGLAATLWPFVSAARALANLRRCGAGAAQAHAVPRWRQLVDMLRLANAWNIAPRDYYQVRLFEGRDPRRFLMRHEVALLLQRLCHGLRVDQGLLDDKARFHAHARAHGLPVPETYALVRADGERWLDAPALPPASLVVKATSLSSGRGFERWRRADGAWTRRGRTLDEAGLLEHARARARQHPLLLQRALDNHAELAPLGPDALATLRLVTGRRPGGPARLLVAGLRVPAQGQEVDNISAGGAIAMVDVATGTLGAAVTDRPAAPWVVHPATGARIEGRALPRWDEAAAAVTRAHETVPAMPFVGWDVALTPDGPVLVEANTVWGGVELAGLGQGEFAECALEHLARLAS